MPLSPSEALNAPPGFLWLPWVLLGVVQMLVTDLKVGQSTDVLIGCLKQLIDEICNSFKGHLPHPLSPGITPKWLSSCWDSEPLGLEAGAGCPVPTQPRRARPTSPFCPLLLLPGAHEKGPVFISFQIRQ